MTLEILQTEMIAALKNKDKFRKDVISSLVGAVKKAGIDNKCRDNISEELVNSVLLKEQKTMQEMIDTCPTSRSELLNEYHQKMAIIKEFAPQLITDYTEIEKIIVHLLAQNNIEPLKKNKGIVMKTIMPHLKGKADMKVVNQVLERTLL